MSCGLIDFGLRLLDVGNGGVGLGLLGADLIGAGFDGLRGLKTRLRELLQGLADRGLLRDDGGFGLEHSGLVGGVGGDGGIELLLGDNVLLDQGRVALDVEVGLDCVGLGCATRASAAAACLRAWRPLRLGCL